jgi:inosine/xanthosine triphosphatase
MPHLVVASTNPVKLAAATQGFQTVFASASFSTEGLSVPSGVADQPMSDSETLAGARTRAANARAARPQADYWIGIEGGCSLEHGALWAFAWVVVQRADDLVGQARTAAFALPFEISYLVRQGVELGAADDRIFGRHNSKQTNGAVGILTADAIDRQHYYTHAVILALIPFCNPTLSWQGEQ